MKRFILPLLALLTSGIAIAAGPIIWSGQNSKDLTGLGLIAPAVTTVPNVFDSNGVIFKAQTYDGTKYFRINPYSDGANLQASFLDTEIVIDSSDLQFINGSIITMPSDSTFNFNGGAAATFFEPANSFAVSLTAPDLNDNRAILFPDSAGTLALLPTLGAGRIAYVDADSLESTAAGTPGQVLTSNGAAAPTWEDSAGGNLQSAYEAGNSIVVSSAEGSINLSSDVGSPISPYLLGIAMDNADSSAYALQISNGAASGQLGIYIEMTDNANTGAGIFSYYGGSGGTYSGGIVSEIAGGAADAAQLWIDAGTGRNLLLGFAGTDSVGVSVPKTGFTSYDLILPSDNGNAGEFLQTDGTTGQLDWARPTTAIVNNTVATSATCTATCASGVLAGGGCNNTLALALQKSYPSSTTVWSCEYAAATGDCTAYAICI